MGTQSWTTIKSLITFTAPPPTHLIKATAGEVELTIRRAFGLKQCRCCCLCKSCPCLTYSPVGWEGAGSGSGLFIWVLRRCLDTFSTVPSAAAPAHKSFLCVTLISLLPFLKCPRGMSGGGGLMEKRWGRRGGGRLQHISHRIDWVHLVD